MFFKDITLKCLTQWYSYIYSPKNLVQDLLLQNPPKSSVSHHRAWLQVYIVSA